jgi:hypothetical protein
MKKFILEISKLIREGNAESALSLFHLEKKKYSQFPGYLAALEFECMLTNPPYDIDELQLILNKIDWFPEKKDWFIAFNNLRLNLLRAVFTNIEFNKVIYRIKEYLVKYNEEPLGLHEIGLFYMKIGNLDASLFYLNESFKKNPESITIKYDIGMVLLAKGELKRAMPFYSWRWALKGKKFTTSIRPKDVKARIIGEPIRGENILIFGEQGLGDQLRIIPLAINYALKNNIKIVYLCDERIEENYESLNVNIKLESFKNYEKYVHLRYIDGFSLLGYYENSNDLINLPTLGESLRLKKENKIIIDIKENGITWWSSHYVGMSRKNIATAPTFTRIVDETEMSGPIQSLQYNEAEACKWLNKEELEKLNTLEDKIDLRNDFSSINLISSKMKKIAGIHSAQLILCAIKANNVVAFVPQGDMLCLGDFEFDPLVKNLRFIRTKYNKTIPKFSNFKVINIQE